MVGETAAGEEAMSSRAEILASVRQSTGDHSATLDAEYAAIPREYRRAGQLNREEMLNLLADRLHDYDAVVYRCATNDIAPTVAAAMAARGKSSLLEPGNLPPEWLPSTHNFPQVDGMSYSELDRG